MLVHDGPHGVKGGVRLQGAHKQGYARVLKARMAADNEPADAGSFARPVSTPALGLLLATRMLGQAFGKASEDRREFLAPLKRANSACA